MIEQISLFETSEIKRKHLFKNKDYRRSLRSQYIGKLIYNFSLINSKYPRRLGYNASEKSAISCFIETLKN